MKSMTRTAPVFRAVLALFLGLALLPLGGTFQSTVVHADAPDPGDPDPAEGNPKPGEDETDPDADSDEPCDGCDTPTGTSDNRGEESTDDECDPCACDEEEEEEDDAGIGSDAPDSLPTLGQRVALRQVAGGYPDFFNWGRHIGFGPYRSLNYAGKLHVTSDGRFVRVAYPGFSRVEIFEQTTADPELYALPVEGGQPLGKGVPADATVRLHDTDGDGTAEEAVLTYPDTRTWTYRFETDGEAVDALAGAVYRLEAIRSRTGHAITIAYNAGDITVTDASGHAYVCAFDSQDRITDITVAGRRWSYAYDGETVTETNHQSGKTIAMTLTVHNRRILVASIITDGGAAGGRRTDIRTYSANGALVRWERNGIATTVVETRTANQVTRVQTTGRRVATKVYGPYGKESETDALGHSVTTDRTRLKQIGRRVDKNGNAWLKERDENGYLVRRQDPDGYTETRTYDGRYNLKTKTTSAGTWRYDYNHRNLVVREEAPGGAVTTFAYDALGRMVRKTGPLGLITEYAYNDNGQVTETWGPYTAAEGRPTASVRYRYDGVGNRTRVVDENGLVTQYSYDGANHLTGVTVDPGGLALSTSYRYDGLGRKVSQTDARGTTTTWTYDERGFVTTISGTGAAGGCTGCGSAQGVSDQPGTYVYSDEGWLERYTDLNDHTWTYTHDNAGRRLTMTDPLRNTTTYSYDAAGRRLTATDPNGRTTRTSYDAAGRRLSVTNGAGETTRFEYDAAGRLVATTHPDGGCRTMRYNAQGQVASSTDALGGETTYRYDEAGRRTAVTNAIGVVTRFDLNSDGTVARAIQDADGRALVTENQYDAGGRLVRAVRDPGGWAQATAYAYDNANRLTTVTVDPDGLALATRYSYNANGQRTAVTVGGRTRSTTYYTAGWVDTVSDGATSTKHEYDRVGNLIRKTVSGRAPVEYVYNEANHLRFQKTVDPDSGQLLTTETVCDGAGLARLVIDPAGGQTALDYDGAGRVIARTNPAGETTRIAYDAMGRRTSVTLANGSSRSYAYNPGGQLVLTSGGPEGTTRYRYDALGRQTAVTDANGRSRTTEYNALSQVVRVENEMGQPVEYEYDRLGRRTVLRDAKGNETRYEYDLAGRLTTMTYPAVAGAPEDVETYTYDGGNLLTSKTTPNGVTLEYSYNSAGQLTLAAGVPYARDGAGAITDDGFATYSYDTLGRLRTNQNGGSTLAYDYDALGRRTRLHGDAAEALHYSYDAAGRLETLRQGAGGPAVFRYDAGGRRTALQLPNGVTTAYQYDSNDRLLGLQSAGPEGEVASFTYTLDAVGNRVALAQAESTQYFEFDGAYRLTKETRVRADGATVSATTYTYDAVGNRLTAQKQSLRREPALDEPVAYWPLDILDPAPFAVPAEPATADPDTCALYHLDEVSESEAVDDSSDHDNDGTHTGVAAVGEAGRFGSAYAFGGDGAGAYNTVVIPDAPSLELGGEDFTIECFLYRAAPDPDSAAAESAVETVLSKDGAWALELYDGAPVFAVRAEVALTPEPEAADSTAVAETAPLTFSAAADTALAAETWTHVAVVRSGGQLILYVAGEPVAQSVVEGLVVDTDEPVRFGADAEAFGTPYTGLLDEVRFSAVARYDRALTPDTSGQAHHALTVEEKPAEVAGPLGGALAFAGGAGLTVADTEALDLGAGRFSIQCHVGPVETTDPETGEAVLNAPRGVLLDKLVDSTGYRLAIDTAGRVVFTVGDGTELVEVRGETVLTTAWTEVTVERRRRGLVLFLDGERDGRSPRFRSTVAANDEPLRLGPGYTGALDNLRLVPDRFETLRSTTTDITYTYNARNQLVEAVEVPRLPGNGRAAALRRRLRTQTTTYTYDRNGNQVRAVTAGRRRREVTHTYDALNRLTATEIRTGRRGRRTQVETHTYAGAEWRRVATSNDAESVNFVYDGDNVLLDKAGGTVVRQYVTPFLDQNLMMTDYTDPQNTNTYYYTQDGLGSVRALTDTTGQTVNRYDYDAWGVPYVPGTQVSVPQRYTYTSRELNPTSGMMYYRYRTYEPGVARFGQRDPIQEAGGPYGNLYVYVDARPTSLLDGFGLRPYSGNLVNLEDMSAMGGNWTAGTLIGSEASTQARDACDLFCGKNYKAELLFMPPKKKLGWPVYHRKTARAWAVQWETVSLVGAQRRFYRYEFSQDYYVRSQKWQHTFKCSCIASMTIQRCWPLSPSAIVWEALSTLITKVEERRIGGRDWIGVVKGTEAEVEHWDQ